VVVAAGPRGGSSCRGRCLAASSTGAVCYRESHRPTHSRRRPDASCCKSPVGELFTQATAAEDRGLEAKARFNLADCDYEEAVALAEKDKPAAIERLQLAISHYRGALQSNPDEGDARANIELAQMLIKKLQDEEKQEQQKQDDQKQDDRQKQDQETQDQQKQDDKQQRDQQQDQQKQDQEKSDEQKQDQQQSGEQKEDEQQDQQKQEQQNQDQQKPGEQKQDQQQQDQQKQDQQKQDEQKSGDE